MGKDDKSQTTPGGKSMLHYMRGCFHGIDSNPTMYTDQDGTTFKTDEYDHCKPFINLHAYFVAKHP